MTIRASVRLYDNRWCFVFFCGPIESIVSAELSKLGYQVLQAEADRGLFSTETRVNMTIETGPSPSSSAAVTKAISDAVISATGYPAIAISLTGDVGAPGIGSPESAAAAAGDAISGVFKIGSWVVTTTQIAIVLGIGLAVYVVVQDAKR
jgi:hypothetical protein